MIIPDAGGRWPSAERRRGPTTFSAANVDEPMRHPRGLQSHLTVVDIEAGAQMPILGGPASRHFGRGAPDGRLTGIQFWTEASQRVTTTFSTVSPRCGTFLKL